MATSDTGALIEAYCDRFADHLAPDIEPLTQHLLRCMATEVPELVGLGPPLSEVAAQVVAANLENVRSAVRCRGSLQDPFVPPCNREFGRLLAQRNVGAQSVLLGYQLTKRVLTSAFIEHAGRVVEDHDDLVLIANRVLSYAFAYTDAATQAALDAHAAAREELRESRKTELAERVAAVLEGAVTDETEAEQILGYPVSGRHVAVKFWFDNSRGRPHDSKRIESRLRHLPGVQDVLVVPKDERTLACWVWVPDEAPIDDWVKTIVRARLNGRVAFGEPETGVEGFRLSHDQARTAGLVLARARKDVSPVVRYQDIAAIAAMVDKIPESNSWVRSVLGLLVTDDEECDRLRNTVLVYLEEGENTLAASRRLFLHRNTVRYRVDQARSLLPGPLEERRLDVFLALTYCKWIPAWEGCPPCSLFSSGYEGKDAAAYTANGPAQAPRAWPVHHPLDAAATADSKA